MLVEIILGSIIAIILLIIISISWAIGIYNTLIKGKQDIANQWSNIKTEYQRRADLLMNLVESVKSYKNHEKSTLTAVIQARAGKWGNTRNLDEKQMKGLDKLFNKMLMTFEAYPNLKANEQHNDLIEELKTTENRINISRTEYNSIVNEYNTIVKMFPTSIISNMFGFTPETFYINEEASNKAPKINLG